MCRGPKRREGRSGTDSPQGWWSLSPWSMQPTFQSTHESVSRDAPKINGFPVPGGTTPSCGFLEGSVGRLADRSLGFLGLWMDLNKGGSRGEVRDRGNGW